MSNISSLKQSSWWLGIATAGAIAMVSLAMAQLNWAQHWGLSALTLSILFGIVIGNTLFPHVASRVAMGVDFSKSTLLRLGIILYGFRITFQQIAEVGWQGVLIDALVLSLTFLLAVQLGTRLFKLDRETAVLIGAGSAICGAAAIMATERVVSGQAHKVSVAVATVVVFGTLSMFAYPLLYPYLGLSEQSYGVFVGSTVHEVAQVVAAGKSVGDIAASSAVITKMLRVMMLAPFLMLLSFCPSAVSQQRKLAIPWFALLFVIVSAVNSTHILPAVLVTNLIQLDTVLLAMAMGALGLRTHLSAIRQAGIRPLLLAATLFMFLLFGGYVINQSTRLLLG